MKNKAHIRDALAGMGHFKMLRTIGEDLGLPFDETNRPYRLGAPYLLDGTQYHRIEDWNPLDDDGDAFRLVLHYGLRVAVFGPMTGNGFYIGVTGEPSSDAQWYRFAENDSEELRAQIVRNEIVRESVALILASREYEN